MLRHHYALIALLMLAPSLHAPTAWGQIALTPQAGLLVLRNGQILEGDITQAGDYYVVTLGTTGEVRLKAADVEALCGSLEEAYEFKVRRLPGKGAAPHLDLAEWCLRHGLTAQSAEQVVAASRIEPDNPRLKLIERRLELAVNAPEAIIAKSSAEAATVSAEKLERAMRELPEGSVEKFAAVVQPLLINRCGAGQCHGPGAKAEFRLLKPQSGQMANRRFTQRNLYATLAWLDHSDPEQSPLLALPQRRHGSSLTPVFDKHSARQLAELTAWVKLTTAAAAAPPAAPAAAPATISANPATLSQPMASQPMASQPMASQPMATTAEPTPPTSVEAMRPVLDPKVDPAADRFVPRDRYDAELFNRRFHER